MNDPGYDTTMTKRATTPTTDGRGAHNVRRHCRSAVAGLVVALGVAGCTARQPILVAVEPATTPTTAEDRVAEAAGTPQRLSTTGVISWYGPRFHGRKTSNGEKFDQRHLTAAHRTLPFGSLVEVTDLATGRQVRVRVNDRGPYVRERVLDLSYAAAVDLGIVKRGIVNARIELISPPLERWPDAVYSVQFGAFRYLSRAERYTGEIEAEHGTLDEAPATYYVVGPDSRSGHFRTRLGIFGSKDAARQAARRLRRAGLDTLVVQEDHEHGTAPESPDELDGATALAAPQDSGEGSEAATEQDEATQSR